MYTFSLHNRGETNALWIEFRKGQAICQEPRVQLSFIFGRNRSLRSYQRETVTSIHVITGTKKKINPRSQAHGVDLEWTHFQLLQIGKHCSAFNLSSAENCGDNSFEFIKYYFIFEFRIIKFKYTNIEQSYSISRNIKVFPNYYCRGKNRLKTFQYIYL